MKGMATKRTAIVQAKEEDRRVTISVRNISHKKWKAFKEKVRANRQMVWVVMDDFLDDYLKK